MSRSRSVFAKRNEGLLNQSFYKSGNEQQTDSRVAHIAVTALAFILLAALVLPGSVCADLIHESATLGPTGQAGGTSLLSYHWIGSRFSVSQTVEVGSIGGHLTRFDSGNKEIFGAIVSLSSPTALPTGSPFNIGEVLASTTFSPPRSNYDGNGPGSDDILVPLSVTLSPGDYALVLGSGMYGATGNGAMTKNNTDLPGSSNFKWDGNAWSDLPLDGRRFVVAPIPEPSTLVLLGMGALGLLGYAWRKRRRR